MPEDPRITSLDARLNQAKKDEAIRTGQARDEAGRKTTASAIACWLN
ncbi:hypothetical protein ACVOMT_13060 [Sphingomonas panni]